MLYIYYVMRLRVKPLNPKIMKNKMKRVVVKNVNVSLCNPEDKFRDMMEEGWDMNDALLELMEEAVLHNKLERKYPNWNPSMLSPMDDGNWEVYLEKMN